MHSPWDLLSNSYLHLFLIAPLAAYLTVGCGVCDTSPAVETYDSDGGGGDSGQVETGQLDDTLGFDINPAMSPVREKSGMERIWSASDWNVFGESIGGQFSWWNAKILGGNGGVSTTI